MKIRTNLRIDLANIELEKIAKRNTLVFINLNEYLKDANGNLKKEYSVEGIHMYPNGYKAVFEMLKKWL